MSLISEDLLKNIAKVPEKEVHWFSEPISFYSNLGHFRKKQRLSKTLISQMENTAHYQGEGLGKLLYRDERVVFKTNYEFLESEVINPDLSPEEKAIRLRRVWGISSGEPISQLHHLVQRKGIFLLRHFLEDLDGYYNLLKIFDPDKKDSVGDSYVALIYVSGDTTYHRSQATIAHELGHIICQHHHPRNDRLSEEDKEKEAWEFAQEFLLPLKFLSKIVSEHFTIEDYRKLSFHFEVSLQMIIKYSYDKGFISHSKYTSLLKQLSVRGERKLERHDRRLGKEKFNLAKALISFLKEKLGYTESDILDIMGFDYREFLANFLLKLERENSNQELIHCSFEPRNEKVNKLS